MLIILVYIAIGYLFFKYLLPLLRNTGPQTRPTEIYQFYEKHPKTFVVTIILALLGINEIFSILGGIFEFIFVPCYPDTGVMSISCFIKENLFLG